MTIEDQMMEDEQQQTPVVGQRQYGRVPQGTALEIQWLTTQLPELLQQLRFIPGRRVDPRHRDGTGWTDGLERLAGRGRKDRSQGRMPGCEFGQRLGQGLNLDGLVPAPGHWNVVVAILGIERLDRPDRPLALTEPEICRRSTGIVRVEWRRNRGKVEPRLGVRFDAPGQLANRATLEQQRGRNPEAVRRLQPLDDMQGVERPQAKRREVVIETQLVGTRAQYPTDRPLNTLCQ